MGRHETSLRVRYAETDQMGVVHHANYYVWMEIGRVELVRARGINYKLLEESEGLFLSVIEARCRFVHPAHYDDQIVVKTEVTNSNPRTVEFSYEICDATQSRVLATGATRHMWLNRAMRPSKLPEKYRDLLGVGATAVTQFPK